MVNIIVILLCSYLIITLCTVGTCHFIYIYEAILDFFFAIEIHNFD